ncbi:hypothetical protein [Streptomyces murinus]|uniref:hypothetical protein n=1 Tax=Streptomyces murinus TaxID=33900 RepID=UPI00382323DE
MVDHSFADLSLAALYDSLNPWGSCGGRPMCSMSGAGPGSCCAGPGPRGIEGG